MLDQFTEKYQEVLTNAEKLFSQDPDWVTFFREVLGVDGVVRKAFPNFEELCQFEKSEQYDRLQKMVVKLREKKNATDTESEPTRVITVRLPSSMHEYLKSEAHDLHTSMNKLCISKLLQVIEQDMIPSERSGSTPPKRNTTPITPITPVTTLRTHQPQLVGAGTSHTSHTSHYTPPLKTEY